MFQVIEEITLQWGILGLRFYSVKYAVAAAATLIRSGVYGHCSIKWLPDPCSRPLETLLDEEPKATEDNQDYIEAPAVDESHTADSSAGRLDKPTFANRPKICFERSFKTKDAPNDDFDAPPIGGGCLSIAPNAIKLRIFASSRPRNCNVTSFCHTNIQQTDTD